MVLHKLFKEKWKESLEQETIEDFFLFSANATSLPHIQDYAAVKTLHEKGLITDNSIFLPGHVSDAWANLFASKTLHEDYPLPPQEYHSGYLDTFNSDIISYIVYRHLMFFPITKKQWKSKEFAAVIDRIKEEIEQYKSNRDGDIWKALEWSIRNRTSLWIVNSVRTYEYYKASFYLPLADYELINFLQKLPLNHILDRNLYARVLTSLFNGSSSKGVPKLEKVDVLSGGIKNNGLKRKIIIITKKIGVYDIFERYKHKHRAERNLNFEHWFTEGKRSESISLETILNNRNIIKYLNPTFFKVIKPYLKKPSYVIHCNGLLSLIFIKTFKQNFEKNKLVTIIIPAYNKQDSISETLNSIYKQTFVNFEILVIDDGSTDNTKQVVESFDKDVVYIYQENQGQGAARNQGIKVAKGDYIVFFRCR